MKVNARHLILDLLLARQGEPIAARELILACELFGISANATRVALARLAAEDLVMASGRGRYLLGTHALDIAGDISTWRRIEQRLRPWQGDYIGVLTSQLGRSDRTALARRERALQLLGFRLLDKGLHVRPNNIEPDVAAVHDRLRRLGLEDSAPVFLISAWQEPDEARVRALWENQDRDAAYLQHCETLETWLERAPGLDPADAARESFLLGSRAIRDLVFDPLLPDVFVDAAARQRFFDAVRRYDAAGHAIWQRFFEVDGGRNDPPR